MVADNHFGGCRTVSCELPLLGPDRGQAYSTALATEPNVYMTPAATQRKRVSQACDRCRSRKDKCDGNKPVCSTCAVGGHDCTYDPSIKKRGLPEGYVRGLEKLWGLTIREAPDVEGTILQLLDKDGIEALTKTWSDKDCDETLLDTWRRSRLSKELDTLLPLLEIADDKTAKRKRPEVPFPPVPTIAADGAPVQPPTGPSNQPTPSDDLPKEEEQRETSKIPRLAQAPSSGKLEIPPQAWELFDIYFSYTHCWLPIIDKHGLLRTKYLYPLDVRADTPGSGDHAALWAVLAYADSQRSGAVRSQNPNSPALQERTWTPTSLYKVARGLIPDEDGEFELGHVQALIVLSLLNMGQNRWKQAWLLIGQAVRIAIDLQLGDQTDDGKSRERHVYFGCFVLDTFIAARMERLPHIRNQEALQEGLLQEEGLDEWSPWVDILNICTDSTKVPKGPGKALSAFNRLVRLTDMLNTIISDPSRVHANAGMGLAALIGNLALPSTSALTGILLPQEFHGDALYDVLTSWMRSRNSSPHKLVETYLRFRSDYTLLYAPPTLDVFATLYIRHVISQDVASFPDQILLRLNDSLRELSKTWPTFNRSLAELQSVRPPSANSRVTNASYPQLRSTRPTMPVPSTSYDSTSQRRLSTMDLYGSPSNSSVYSGAGLYENTTQYNSQLLQAQGQGVQSQNRSTQPMTNSPWTLPFDASATSAPNTNANRRQSMQVGQGMYQSPATEGDMFEGFAGLEGIRGYVILISRLCVQSHVLTDTEQD